MLAKNLTVGSAHFGLMGEVFLFVDHEPRQPGHIRGFTPGSLDNGANVFQRLPHLANEIIRYKFLVLVPADLAANMQHAVMGQHAIGIAFGRSPTFGVNGLMGHVCPFMSFSIFVLIDAGHGAGRPCALICTKVVSVAKRSSSPQVAVIS